MTVYQVSNFFRLDQAYDQVAAESADQTLVTVALLSIRVRGEQIGRQGTRVRVSVVVQSANEPDAYQVGDVTLGQTDWYVCIGGSGQVIRC